MSANQCIPRPCPCGCGELLSKNRMTRARKLGPTCECGQKKRCHVDEQCPSCLATEYDGPGEEDVIWALRGSWGGKTIESIAADVGTSENAVQKVMIRLFKRGAVIRSTEGGDGDTHTGGWNAVRCLWRIRGVSA